MERWKIWLNAQQHNKYNPNTTQSMSHQTADSTLFIEASRKHSVKKNGWEKQENKSKQEVNEEEILHQ